MENYLVVLTTMERKDDAERIARKLIEEKLAACIQIMPIESFYRWEGKVENSGEYLCLIKTRAELYTRLEHRLKALHPYEIPEIIALPVKNGSSDYLSWLLASTS